MWREQDINIPFTVRTSLVIFIDENISVLLLKHSVYNLID